MGFVIIAHPVPAQADTIKTAINRYNQLLADGYRTMNMNQLQQVATVDQATKLYHHMAALGEARLRMDSSLKGISFIKIEQQKPGVASVQTRETWDFSHISTATGKKESEELSFIYEMRYSLKQENGRWIITNVDTLSGKSSNKLSPQQKQQRP